MDAISLVTAPDGSPALKSFLDTVDPNEMKASVHAGLIFLGFPLRGLQLRVEKDTRLTDTVFFFGKGAEEGYGKYSGELPHGLRFGMTREEVLRDLGPSAASAEESESREYSGYVMVTVYKDGGLSMVSITRDG